MVEAVSKFYSDPLGYVYFAFDWGRAELENESGPDEWQSKILQEIGLQVKNGNDAIEIAVKSGHGVGKTALVAWIILWFMSTRPHPQGVVTANTKSQLEQKTWRELAKWHKLSINRDWFEWTATKFYLKQHPETWFASAVPWSKEKSEAFAGTHEKYVLMIFDEASSVEDIIWEVAEGAMTTKGAIWIAFGNPTRNTGRFKECWGRFRHRWKGFTVDSRTAKKANKVQIQKWIEDYGEDSDFVRIRALGEFPRAASNQFIPENLITEAWARENVRMFYSNSPVVMGVDVARYGDDQSVIVVRQGMFLEPEVQKYRELDLMTLVGKITEAIKKYQPQNVFVDVIGLGAGVVDRLLQLGYRNVIGVNSAEEAFAEKDYMNLRAEMWGKMRDWLKTAIIPFRDEEMKAGLIGPEYGFDAKNRIQLERKEDMKARGLASPDVADALALTFAVDVHPVAAFEHMQKTADLSFNVLEHDRPMTQRPEAVSEFNPLGG